MHFALSLLVCCLVACAPYRPPPEPPRLVVARAPVRVFAEAAAPAQLTVLVRAGTAYDPVGREGTAFVYAHGVAALAGVSVEVGPELVAFVAPPGAEASLAKALGASVSPDILGAGRMEAAVAYRGHGCRSLARRLVEVAAWAGTPYGHAAAGRDGVPDTLSVGELEGFRSLRYVRDAVVVIADGAVDATAFATLFPPVMSRTVTPAIRARESRPSLVVGAPVSEACTAFSPQRLDGWSPTDEAAYLVARELAGLAPSPARVDPAVSLELDGAFAEFPGLTGDFAAARYSVAARLTLPTARWTGEWALLGSLRGSQFPAVAPVKAAIEALTEPALTDWLAARFGGDAVVVQVHPAAAALESLTTANVVSSEDMLR